jgi:anti-sigma regulatory factor (Ser/Thr protein kinase)
VTEDVVKLQFRHVARPAAIGRARQDVEDALASNDVDARTSEDAMLLVSELVTNAVRHARTGRFEVRLQVRPERLRIEVQDDGLGFEPRVAPSRDGTGGYGLLLVDRVADRWGVARDARGVIWLELDRPGH